MSSYHIPVLYEEALSYLNIIPGKIYVDCTLGGAGHTTGILKRGGIVLAIDQDSDAHANAQKELAKEIESKQLLLAKGNFAHLQELAQSYGINQIAGILLDLGVSSHQLETDSRGFSFNRDAVLDMRMDRENLGVSAKDLVNAAGEKELAHIFFRFGEEHAGRAIAAAIVKFRAKKPIETTNELAEIVLSVRNRGKGDRTHPATRIFQALRIAVNDELNSLEMVLPQARDLLEKDGRLAVISFHSLEDRIVKTFFRDNKDLLTEITDKPIGPTDQEVDANPRARSGKLRVAQKI